MPKLTTKEKLENQKKQMRYDRGYKDFLWLMLIIFIVWLFEAPAVAGLLLSSSRSHFHSYGIFMTIISFFGFSLTVLLLALDKRKASIIVSSISAGLILLLCALIYIGYNRALNTSNLMAAQIIFSYVSSLSVPIADIIMVNRRM